MRPPSDQATLSMLLLSIIAIALLLPGANGEVYVSMKEGVIRCFIEEVPRGTTIAGRYTTSQLNNMHMLGTSATIGKVGGAVNQKPFADKQFNMKVQITSLKDGFMMLDQVLPKEAGKFSLEAPENGSYKICFQTDTSSWFNAITFRFQFELDTGSDSIDYDKVAKVEHISGLDLEVRKLKDRCVSILAELTYQKDRERVFRGTSESTNSRAAWFSVLQISIVAVSAVMQGQYLRYFFRKKKLI
eukprot:TRINITY_DN8985_c0_g1_i1.p1 TRINITY_DN8985_c0_g1~~TRINITY_DN8985_c0_g1_i1.p1  ORF type:complete len:251 (+),score=54.11 TRINITY_DN8985_c0_g1_i1:23-754(+)